MAYPTAAGNPSMSGGYIPEIWSGKFLIKFYKTSVFPSISNTDYEGEITNQGDKVIIRTVPDITIGSYDIGQGLTYEKPRGSTVELLIDKGKVFAFEVNDVEKLQSDLAYMDKWSDDAAQQMKIAIDSTVLDGIVGDAHSSNKGATAGAISGNIDMGSAGTPIQISKANSIDFLVESNQALTEQDVPETDRWVVIPAWYTTRLKTSDLKDVSMMGDNQSSLRNGRIGRIDNLTIYQSNNLYTTTDGGNTVWYMPMGHTSAITFVSQLVKNETLRNQDDFGDLVRGLQVFGFKTIKSEALCELYARPVSL